MVLVLRGANLLIEKNSLLGGNIGEIDVTLPAIASAAIGRTITVKKLSVQKN
jgi:hypothetical protein